MIGSHGTDSHTPQSLGHVKQFSSLLHTPSPQVKMQTPQSSGQLLHVSYPLHVPSPHNG